METTDTMTEADKAWQAQHEEQERKLGTMSARSIREALETYFACRMAVAEAEAAAVRFHNFTRPGIGGKGLDDARDEALRQKLAAVASEALQHARDLEAVLLDWQSMYDVLRGR